MREFVYELEELLYENFWDERVEVLLADGIIVDDFFDDLIIKDTMWALGSVSFVFLYLWFHLGSFFLSFIGVILIVLSFPISALITEGILQIEYFAALQMFVIFVVLGIAADDIFVFIDAWRQSERIAPEVIKKDDLHGRMAYTFRRAVRAIAFTSITTCAAFFANIFSPVMPIKSFGAFAGTIVIVNYAQVCLIFPCAVIVYEQQIKPRCNWKQKIMPESLSQGGISIQEKVEIFLGTYWCAWVKKLRYGIIGFFFIWLIVTMSFASGLGPLTKPEAFIKRDHHMVLPFSIQEDVFQKKATNGNFDSQMWIHIAFGIKGIDQTKSELWDPEEYGKLIVDNDLDPSTKESQVFLLGFCERLKESELIANKKTVNCWIDKFNQYLSKMKIEFPIETSSEFNQRIGEWWEYEQKKQYERNSDEDEGLDITDHFYIKDGRIKFMHIWVASRLHEKEPANIKYPEYDRWQVFMNKERKMAPKELKSMLQSSDSWPFMTVERSFYISAIQGMVIALFFSFFIILVATRDITLSLISILCISIIISTVICVIVWEGWELGISESCGIVISIGLSVDYVVHLAADYVHSKHEIRSQKMEQAYKNMGISIISGTITTFGSSIFLFGADLWLYQKFAVIISTTISTSFLVSMTLFGALCHTIGPQGQGLIERLITKMKNK